ncbi:MAG TPA: heme exporter protein CcmD [Acetobacteraceae bacterium]|nr:heme exporter protein CcmD [Acetobacteraceae bacterium]
MTHLPYILGSYAAFAVIALWLALSASFRLRHARRRLNAVDPRAGQRQT